MTTEPRWLDDQQLDAWKRLVAVVELLPGVLDSQLRRDADLSHFEYYVLARRSEAPGRRRAAGARTMCMLACRRMASSRCCVSAARRVRRRTRCWRVCLMR